MNALHNDTQGVIRAPVYPLFNTQYLPYIKRNCVYFRSVMPQREVFKINAVKQETRPPETTYQYDDLCFREAGGE